MLKLVISDDEGKTTSVPLVRDEITIGRKEGNTIRLTDRNISRRHARLQKQNGHYLLHDLGSYNGIVVNGGRISADARPVKHGDTIIIGDYKLAILEDAQPGVAPPASQGTPNDTIESLPAAPPAGGLVNPAPTSPGIPSAMSAGAPSPFGAPRTSAPPAQPAGVPQQSAGEAPPLEIRQMRLVFLAPAGAPPPFTLDKLPIILGRSEVADVSLPFSSISREHARISYQNGSLYIEDLNSSNGITVNGNKAERAPLNQGDLVTLGVVEFRVAAGGDSTMIVERPRPRPAQAAPAAAMAVEAEPATEKKRSMLPLALGGFFALLLVAGGAVAVVSMNRGGSTDANASMPVAVPQNANPPANNVAQAGAGQPANVQENVAQNPGANQAQGAQPAGQQAGAAPQQLAVAPQQPVQAPAQARQQPAQQAPQQAAIPQQQVIQQPAAQQQQAPAQPRPRDRDRDRNRNPAGGNQGAAQPAQPAQAAGDPLTTARACPSGPDRNQCIISALRGRARNEAELRLLAIAYRSSGDHSNAVRTYQRLLQVNPNTNGADSIRAYLESQGAH